MKGKSSVIKALTADIGTYDTIVLTTPIWASSPVPAINAFVEQTDFRGKQVVLLVSTAGGDDSKASALLTEKIQSKGGKVLQHHAFKNYKAAKEELVKQAQETARLYK